MNYLSKIVLMGAPFLCTTSLFSAFIMDSGRMNSEPGYNASPSDYNSYPGNHPNDGYLSYNAPSYEPHKLDSSPSFPQDTYYRYSTPGMDSHQRADQQEGQFNPNPNKTMNYNNKNHDWADNYDSSKNNSRDDDYDDSFHPSNNTKESRWIVADNSSKTLMQHAPKSDDDISQKIRMAIKNDAALAGIVKDVEVSVKNGNVTLKGTVHTTEEKNKIDYIANSVDGVKNVSNQLIIKNR